MVPRGILVPLERDSHAEHTLAYAVSLATALHAAATLLHVVEPGRSQDWGDSVPLASATAMSAAGVERDTAAHCFMAEKLQCARHAGLLCDAMVIPGVPFQMIVNVARARRVDLIVMGSHGRTGLAHLVLGSVAERVVRLAPCPVLVVRDSSHVETYEDTRRR